ncbi:P-loop NTPase fold protein [Niallia circulans]|uniref:NTPase n=1 Tax=Niallia circulans TaxID=1397 RepID=A0A941JL59_NIACI|nr:P-loop NTPase fold protein [Niallia circulans]MCB5237163.1 NTPase [Niallia circulans]
MWKDSETELDFLDFDYLIGLLDELIEDDTLLPSSIGVYGDWGSGKSSLIRMSMKKAEQREGTVCLNFNGWLFEGYEDAKTALVGSILDAIQLNQTLSEKAKKTISVLYKSIDKFKLVKNGIRYGADILLSGGVGTLLELSTKELINQVKGNLSKNKLPDLEEDKIIDAIKSELGFKELREDIKEFQVNFAKLLEESNIKRLVIFIDELDRCSPDTILETLEAIRLFLFTGNSIFIIGADERHISYAVQRKFDEIEGQQINIGKEYLEKIIQYPIRIPRLSSTEMKFYITCLLFEKRLTSLEFEKVLNLFNEAKSENFFKFAISYELIKEQYNDIAEKVKEDIVVAEQLSDVLAQGLNGNPRHCKRFLNSLVMREKMSSYKKIELDRKILAKLMMLEYFKPTLFKQIAEFQGNSQELNKQLNELENGNLSEANVLKIWNDDKWVEDWCNIDPKFDEVDLTPYFYFSRDSLNNKSFNSLKKLSHNANKIFEQLISGSKSARMTAIKEAINISDYEAVEILQMLFTKLIGKSNIGIDIFISYLDWGKTKESLFAQVLNDLNSLPASNLKLPMVPLISDYIKHTKQFTVFQETMENWKKENPKFVTALEKSFTKGEK